MATPKKQAEKAETPLMKQYNQIKTKHPTALLLFRVGDFYETFGEDAIKASQILGIVLTARNNGGSKLELAGFPHHSLDTYLPKLVRAGQRVAICDQLEDPKLTKTIVKRGVTELVTPGVSFNDNVLEQKSNNFLASVFFDKKEAGVSFLDISTGEFLTAEGPLNYIEKLLQSIRPTEIIYPKNKSKQFVELNSSNTYSFAIDEWVYTSDYTNELLLKHFKVKSLKGFGVEKLTLGTTAAGSILHYLAETHHNQIDHINKIARIEQDKYVWLDRFTIRNLELLSSSNEGAKTFIDVLDKTVSPMGSRLLKRWIALPLKDKFAIDERLNTVDFLLKNTAISKTIENNISQIGDLERLISKVAVARINPREVAQLKIALQAIQPIIEICKQSNSPELKLKVDKLNPCLEILQKITIELKADPPVILNKGNVIANGVNTDLDDLRKLAYSGKDYLLQIQQRETERTGIQSLKIAFNNVFGYYLEVRNTHKDKVPEEWIRKQTLVNAERYITEELKEYESKILGAEEKILALETQIFNSLVAALADYIMPIQVNANIVGQLDCMLSFAKIAKNNNYTKPVIQTGKDLKITAGRHPVIEQQLPVGEEYVPNDVFLDDKTQQIIMITGPNMAGKSALLRQTALIVLMAQTGSFVPAKAADIGLVDKIFTRVGASDNISQGESTFMVEMNETASILNNISDRSLILLDEIGRGTSTYDGVSIAWAIAEFLHQNSNKPKTLFATHYHELNEMTNIHKRIKNYNVSVKELNNKIIFLRKLVQGGSEHSFGIHVAKMAGMPRSVLNKANEVLAELEKSHSRENLSQSASKTSSKIDSGMQLSFFKLDDPVLEQIKEDILGIDINSLTPVEALIKLNEIKKLIGS